MNSATTAIVQPNSQRIMTTMPGDTRRHDRNQNIKLKALLDKQRPDKHRELQRD